jgi:hypothetical protein
MVCKTSLNLALTYLPMLGSAAFSRKHKTVCTVLSVHSSTAHADSAKGGSQDTASTKTARSPLSRSVASITTAECAQQAEHQRRRFGNGGIDRSAIFQDIQQLLQIAVVE